MAFSYQVLRRQKEARIEKNVGSIKQQDNTKSAQFISNKQVFNIPMLCTHDKLPEVRHVDQDFRAP